MNINFPDNNRYRNDRLVEQNQDHLLNRVASDCVDLMLIGSSFVQQWKHIGLDTGAFKDDLLG